ncbi:alpha-2-macroglobulin family protein [Leisingera sp. McT4-56]|uniref:alpha-2-macroglobulin family protein n=1 Tax=Leisingera sp. McT4-56 TaxID=2881255 RepID=UPI001CF7FE66|nr:alpha-2-macroglobulin family protein [Leisingera sp. McT4-56]MCB4457108.1 alpha-2-macroglobulin family protein [Leisingera sp. McT4-56]
MPRLFASAFLYIFAFFAVFPAAWAGPAVPGFRYQSYADTDFFGSDLQPLFDTDVASCARACSAQADCAGFVFNQKANACFPKSALAQSSPYAGAVSAVKQPAAGGLAAAAASRAARLDFLPEQDLQRASGFARSLGLDYPLAAADAAEARAAARARLREGDSHGALRWMAQAVVLSDAAADWTSFSGYLLRAAKDSSSRSQQRRYRSQAYAAALNGYLRAADPAAQAEALAAAARVQELQARGRAMLPLLRLAQDIAPDAARAAQLEDAIAKYGFRVLTSTVESDSAAPRICAEFSEDLEQAGTDYENYVRLPEASLAVTAQGRQLCLDGVEHGKRYRLTLRRGLPAASGEQLYKDVELTHYVRDRAPQVRFPGRAYVLPAGGQAALPVETVNLTELDLRLRRVSSRNVLRTLQEGYFAKPLSQWEDEHFAENIAEEIWTGSAEVDTAINQVMTSRLPLDQALNGQKPGLYALTARVPGADPYDDAGATQWFVLTGLGLSTMSGSDGLHVQVQALADAKPHEGAEVSLISAANEVLASATSDASGHVHFAPGLTRGTGGAAPALITARAGEGDFTFLPLNDAAFDLSDRGVSGRPAPGPVDVFLATTRGAFRAGETVHVTALARDSKAQAIDGLPLTAILLRPDGVEYTRQTSAAGHQGGHVFALATGPAAPRGTWRIEIKSDLKAPTLASRQILVEDFLPERIDFEQEVTNAASLQPGGAAQIALQADYLFGAPGAGLKVEGSIRLTAANTLSEWPGFRFGRYDEASSAQTEHFGGQETGPDGSATFTVSLPAAAPAEGKPLLATLTTRVADGSARPVERSLALPVRPAGPVLGIKPLFDEVAAEGSEAGFELIALTPDLQPMPMRVKWTLNRVETRYQWYQLYGNWNWEPITRRTRIATGEAQLGSDPLPLSQPVDWGRYELVVERLDGEYASAAFDFYAGWYAPEGSTETPARLDLSLDSESYAPGDTARLRIVPQAAGTALVSVVSNHLIHRMAVEVPAGETVIPLEVTQDWGSGAYVTATVIQPVAGDRGRTPLRALGLAHASVTQPDLLLQVAIDVPEVTRPRGTQVAKLRVDGAAEGEEVWLTVAAVDLGILNLTGFTSPDPSAHYYGQRRLGMELRDVYGRLIDPGNGAMGRIRSGGDADGGMKMQSPPPTQDLVALFSGPLKVDASGEAEFPLTLPAFNGTVRLMAVAWSGKAVGQAEADMLVRDPVVVTASLPRFLAPGDESGARIEIVHADGPAGDMKLTATTAGGLTLGSLPASVTLAEQGKAVLELPVTAESVGDHELTLTLTTPDGQDLRQTLPMPVRANDPVTSETRRFTLAGGDTFVFSKDVFTGLRAGTARATISSGPLAKFDVPGLLAELDQYPYGCTEQVTSKALPLLYLSSVAQAAGLGDGPAVDKRINAAIRQVLTRQAPSGAFGLWRADSGEFWLDAYASDFLSRARAQGYAVPQQAFAQAMDNLRNRINYAPDFDSGGEEIAYALLVLAREGAAQMGDLRYYADVKGDAFATPLAAAQLGAALAAYGDQRRADRMFTRAAQMITSEARDEARLWRADFGTRLRDTAGVLALTAEAGSEAVDRASLSARLSNASGYRSTQESAWTLMAAHALTHNPEDSDLLVNGQPVQGPFVEAADGQDTPELALTAASGRTAEITLTTLGVPEVPPAAGGFGYTIERSYYSLEGQPLDAQSVSAGARFVAVLQVKPHEKTGARLMINDPLPAGFEIDNPNLLRSGDLRDLDWLNPAEAEHAEFRSDRFLAALNVRDASAVTLAYVVRAVTPGVFHHPAASVEDMYRPAYRARTAAGRVEVR